MHLDIDGTGGAFMTSLWQLKRFEARISLFKSLDCPLALAAAGMNQRFTRYPPVMNHNLGWCNWTLCSQGWHVGAWTRSPTLADYIFNFQILACVLIKYDWSSMIQYGQYIINSNGLESNRHQAFTWTSDEPVQWHKCLIPLGLNELSLNP